MMPILGALVLQAAYGAVDLLVVGRFGTTAGLSAVSTGSQVLNLVTFVLIQLAMGMTVLIARYIGEKRQEGIGAVIGGSTVVFAMISAVLFVVMICLQADIGAYASSRRSPRCNCGLCPYLRRRNFLHRCV